MDIPSYLELKDQDIYHEEMNQTLQQGLSNNGWTVPNITNDELTVDIVPDPFGYRPPGVLADLMPVGSIWFVTNHAPPVFVGKVADGPTVLQQFTMAAYP